MAQSTKKPPAVQETRVRLGGEGPGGGGGRWKHSSVLAWGIARSEEPGGLQLRLQEQLPLTRLNLSLIHHFQHANLNPSLMAAFLHRWTPVLAPSSCFWPKPHRQSVTKPPPESARVRLQPKLHLPGIPSSYQTQPPKHKPKVTASPPLWLTSLGLYANPY